VILAPSSSGDGVDVLFVCTGNQCRSPLSAALLERELDRRHISLTVGSAGFVSEGVPPPEELTSVAANSGIDIGEHRSRLLTPSDLAAAGLVVTMARQHLIDVAVMSPDDFPRCFTFTDVLRRARAGAGRTANESVRAWANRLSAGRLRSSVLTLSLSEDIPDPMGRSQRFYRNTVETLAAMTTELCGLISPA
jgi:protein-tyrosine phosphatase